MGLYDQYQLANSNQVQQYQGSATPEMMKVADIMQQRYDTSKMSMEQQTAQMNAGAGSVLPQDQALYAARTKEYQDKIDEISKRPDLENTAKDVLAMGRRFGYEYQNFSNRMQQYQAYRQELDKNVDKKYNTQEQADTALAMSLDSNGPLQYDAKTGKYNNSRFTGIIPARMVDTNDWIKKAVGDVVGQKIESVVKAPDQSGDYFVKTTNGTTRLSADKLKTYAKLAYANDQEIQAYFNQSADMAAWKSTRGVKLHDIQDPNLRQQIADHAAEAGVDPDKYAASYMHQATRGKHLQNMYDNLINFGTKYAQNDVKYGNEIDGETIEGKKKITAIDQPAFLFSSPDFRLADKQKDVSALQETSSQADATIGNLEQKLTKGNLHPDEVNDLRQQLLVAKSNKAQTESILQGARDDAAKQMGYKDYNDYVNRPKGRDIEQKYNNLTSSDAFGPGNQYKNGVPATDINGNKALISKSDLVKALHSSTVTDNPKGGWDVEVSGKHYHVGAAVNGGPNDGDQGAQAFMNNLMSKAADTDFNDRFKKNIKDNAENYAVKTTETPLTDAEATNLKTSIMADPAAFEIRENGKSDPIKASDMPPDLKLGGIKVMKENGKFFVTAYGLKHDPKNGTVATGKQYTITIPAGSNTGQVIGKRMLMQKGNPNKPNEDQDMRGAAAILMGGESGTSLMRLQNDEKMPIVTNDGETLGYVERKGYSTSPGADSRYLIYGSDGKEISTSIPESVRKDPQALGQWLDMVKAQHEMKAAKKK